MGVSFGKGYKPPKVRWVLGWSCSNSTSHLHIDEPQGWSATSLVLMVVTSIKIMA